MTQAEAPLPERADGADIPPPTEQPELVHWMSPRPLSVGAAGLSMAVGAALALGAAAALAALMMLRRRATPWRQPPPAAKSRIAPMMRSWSAGSR